MAASDTRKTKWYSVACILFALVSIICECRGAQKAGVHYGDCSASGLVRSVSGRSPTCKGYELRQNSDEVALVHYWPLHNSNLCHGWEAKDAYGNRLFMSARDIRCAGKGRITYTEFYGTLNCNGTASSIMNKSLTTTCTAGNPLTSFELLTDATACSPLPEDYCGDCYIGEKKSCCNTCASVKRVYQAKKRKFNPDTIAQCRGDIGTQPRLVKDYKSARPGQAVYEDGLCCNGCSLASLASVSYPLSLSLLSFSFFSLT